MHIFDGVNGTFEALGALVTWANAYKLYKDRCVRGVYWPATGFFSVWGLWNLFYYPHLHQWMSTVGGALLVVGNLVWVVFAIHLLYGYKPLGRAFLRGARRALSRSLAPALAGVIIVLMGQPLGEIYAPLMPVLTGVGLLVLALGPIIANLIPVIHAQGGE